jgi:hypothetical protein
MLFRLRHLKAPRHRRRQCRNRRVGWEPRPSPRPGCSGDTWRGIGYAQGSGAVVAIAAEVAIKVRFAPVPAFAGKVIQRELDLMSAPEVYRPALVAELQARPYEFDIQVQLCADLSQMPVENVTIEWPEQLSPFVTVAKLRLPQQDISGGDNLEKMDALSFTPWRVTAAHAPLGNIMRVRKEVYRHASILRHELNRQQRTEPCSVDQVLPSVCAGS